MFQRYIGGRAFYRRVFGVAIPIIIQSGITNFVNLLDNIMVGQIGTIPMSGVSIVNGLLFVFNMCAFGASSGAGIFTAQFYGSEDAMGVRHTFRYKFLACSALAAIGAAVFLIFGDSLIGLYLTGEGDAASAEEALQYGLQYLNMMVWGFLPFALSNAYASTLRETGQTTVPMVAGVTAVGVNLIGNYILIFGHFGAPEMGVEGAALATVLSRYVEFAILAGWTHAHREKNTYIVGVFRSFYIPGPLLRSIVRKGLPLMLNEFFWASGVAVLNQCYSTCGLDVVPAMNISTTLFNLGSVVSMSMGNSVGILMGQLLGSGAGVAEARDTNWKLIAVTAAAGMLFGGLVALSSGLFPQLYNTTGEVRQLAGQLIRITALMMPFNAYTISIYFTLRSGGQTLVTFLFDSCFTWVVCVPLAYVLSRFTQLPILPLYFLCQSTELIKSALGTFMLKQGKWIQNLTV